jgi:uncharacterized protein (UPF0261 family)
MHHIGSIAVIGTFDSKGEEHLFLKTAIENRGCSTLTVNLGTKGPASFPADVDLFRAHTLSGAQDSPDRDKAIEQMAAEGAALIRRRWEKGEIAGIIAAGGGTGTHLCSRVMHVLPLGVPKVMVSTVASRDMAEVVGTKDMTMMHSVVDILGVNGISGPILDKAAAAVCAMAQSRWQPPREKKRVGLSFFGFITTAAEAVREHLENMGYEVIPFHANGTGGMAMEELAAEGLFDGILDLATHELADHLMHGYCGAIGPGRFEPVPGDDIPRLVVPGGLDCAVLEFTRNSIPAQFADRQIFFYDFRSAIRLSRQETLTLAGQLSEKLNRHRAPVRVLNPTLGWSEADKADGPLYAPEINQAFMEAFTRRLQPQISVSDVEAHINAPQFARRAAEVMDEMIQTQ